MDYQSELESLINRYKEGNEYLKSLNIIIGQNILDKAFDEVPKYGKKVLFCTGRSAMKKLGFYQKFLDLFNEHGVDVVPYEGITANPTVEIIENGVKIAKENNVDFIFSLGGGSVIDTGKAIAVGLYGNIWDFVEKKAEIKRALPIIACSTTTGTGSHVTPYAVISNQKTIEKKTLKNNLILPKLSIVDVEITRHAPSYVVATTGFDVLCHAMEVYTRNEVTPAASEFALKAIELVGKYLLDSYHSKEDIDAKIGMAYADVFAGIALALIGTHLQHAISHPISARFPEINHGQALAYVTPKSFEIISKKASPELKKKLETISKLLGGSGDLVETLDSFIKKLNLDKKIVNFTNEQRDIIYNDVLRYRWSSVVRTPVPISKDDVRKIIFESL